LFEFLGIFGSCAIDVLRYAHMTPEGDLGRRARVPFALAVGVH
jgi:hypothetical protein